MGVVTSNTPQTSVPVKPGQSIYTYAYSRALTTGRSTRMNIAFWDNSQTKLISSTSGTAATNNTGSWTLVPELTLPVPDGAAYATIYAIIFGPANGEVHYVDDFFTYVSPGSPYAASINNLNIIGLDSATNGFVGAGDGSISARKVGKIDMPESQNNRTVSRPFMITMRASDPTIKSRAILDTTAVAVASGLTFDSGGAGVTLSAVFGTTTLSIENKGNYYSYPVVRLYGQMVNPVLVNLDTLEKISIKTSISEGDYIDVDVLNRTVVDQDGNNQYGFLAIDHDWMRLIPGINNLSLGNDSFSGSASVKITWQYSWI
jgi:hypothetical protein